MNLPYNKLWDKENRENIRIKIIIAIIIFILLNISAWVWPGWECFSWPEFIFFGIGTAWGLYVFVIAYPYWLIERN